MSLFYFDSCDICYNDKQMMKKINKCNCNIKICVECLINICHELKTDVLFLFFDLAYKCPMCRKYIYYPKYFEFLESYLKERFEKEIFLYIRFFLFT
jgi:hypothetical protein